MTPRLLVSLLALAACRSPQPDAAASPNDLPATSARLSEAAAAAHAEGRWDEARRQADLAVRLDRTSPHAWVVRGRIRRTLRERGATHDLDRALALDPENAGELLSERASVRRLGGDPEGALVDLDAALEHDAESVTLHARRGSLLGVLGRHEDAFAAFERAQTLDDGRHQTLVLMNRAMVHVSVGALDRARVDLASVFDADPEFTYAALMLVGLGGDRSRLEGAVPQDEWSGRLREVMLGTLDPRAAVAEAARAPHPVLARERLCEAWAYLGMRAELEGRQADAFVAYARALETDVPDFFEYVIASARLDALAPDDGDGEEGDWVVGE